MAYSKRQVYEDLRHKIITNELEPGQILNERELTDQYGISRTPLREVLMELQRDALVQRFPRSGTFVAPLEIQYLREVIEIRLELESLAGRLAAHRIGANQLAEMKDALDGFERHMQHPDRDFTEIADNEFLFHDIVYRAANNEELKTYLYRLYGICARFWCALNFGHSELSMQYNDLKEMYEALSNGDGDAAGQVMKRHLREFVDQVKQKI